MTAGTWFWLIYVLALVFGLVGTLRPGSPAGTPYPYYAVGHGWVLWILVGILGLHNFGSPIK